MKNRNELLELLFIKSKQVRIVQKSYDKTHSYSDLKNKELAELELDNIIKEINNYPVEDKQINLFDIT